MPNNTYPQAVYKLISRIEGWHEDCPVYLHELPEDEAHAAKLYGDLFEEFAWDGYRAVQLTTRAKTVRRAKEASEARCYFAKNREPTVDGQSAPPLEGSGNLPDPADFKTRSVSAAPTVPAQPGAGSTPPSDGAGKPMTGTASPAPNVKPDEKGYVADPADPKLSRRVAKAGADYEAARQYLVDHEKNLAPTDKNVYDKLLEMYKDRRAEADLPNFDTWARDLRRWRKATGNQKNRPRHGRPARSVVPTSQL